jgi:hypothetical protein
MDSAIRYGSRSRNKYKLLKRYIEADNGPVAWILVIMTLQQVGLDFASCET